MSDMNLAVPVSVGELVDKITILRIKSRNITDPVKLTHVRSELQALEQVCQQHQIDAQSELALRLESINQELWDIEDAIRDQEREKDFGEKFISLARAVYVTNDKRFAVKSQINEFYGSAYREEKSYQEY